MIRRSLLAATLALFAGGCIMLGPTPEISMAQARVSPDFETYNIYRVGLMPFAGREIDPARRLEIQDAFQSEFSQSTPFEIVSLRTQELQEVTPSDPYFKGNYKPRTIIDISRRHNFDAIFFGTITQERFYPPQVLSIQLDLVAAETGLVVWSGSIHLDADDPRVAEGLQAYYGGEDDKIWQLALISPERFARFAAFQMACLL